jgi:hypothetical protein
MPLKEAIDFTVTEIVFWSASQRYFAASATSREAPASAGHLSLVPLERSHEGSLFYSLKTKTRVCPAKRTSVTFPVSLINTES